MPKLKTINYTLPAFWACYLINGDASYLEDNEALQIEAFIAGEGLPWGCLSCSEDNGNFCKFHDARPYGVLACDCLTYTFAVPKVKSPFQTVMRDYCEWWTRPSDIEGAPLVMCDRWGCAMDAAFKVSDYMAATWSEYPLEYSPGLGGAGNIIEEAPDLEEYLNTLTREDVRKIAQTLGRYTKQLERAGHDY